MLQAAARSANRVHWRLTDYTGYPTRRRGQGAVIWVFISELFPRTKERAVGQTVGAATHWCCANCAIWMRSSWSPQWVSSARTPLRLLRGGQHARTIGFRTNSAERI